MNLGDRLRQIRRDNLLTQQDIAAELHVSRQTVSGWETGRSYPDITSLITLAETYHLSLDEMLREDASATADLVKQDQQRKEARIVYYSVYAVDLVLVALIFLNAFEVHAFHLTPAVQMVLTAVALINMLAIGPSYRRYRILRHKSVERTLSWGSVALGVLTLVVILAMFYGVGGLNDVFWGGATGGISTLVVMVIYHRVRFGPMRKTWSIW